MKGNSKPLLKFMEGSDTRFVIPVYQRNYDWKKENCEQLLSDLLTVVDEDRPSHFFGSIVSVSEGSNNVIIDGQQRLTTVSLLLLALRNLIVAEEVPCDQANLADKITNDYLVDQWQPEDRKIKLKPVKDDMKAFNRLFTDPDDLLEASKVTQNYRFFHRAIQDRGVKADDLFSAIRRLIIIDITLEDGDNPSSSSSPSTPRGSTSARRTRSATTSSWGCPAPCRIRRATTKAAVAGKPARRSRRLRERHFPKPQDYTQIVNDA